MYDTLFGGIEAFSTEHFQLVNGFSNQFFGWGGEDDNLYDRFGPSVINKWNGKLPTYVLLVLMKSKV